MTARGLAPSLALLMTTLALPPALHASRAAILGDLDGDGWTVADGDCCDEPGAPCTLPALVNPGAFEAAGDGLDNDCDGTVDNPAPTNCVPTPVLADLTGTQLAGAMDLCQLTLPSPPPSGRTWGLISATLARADGSAPSPPEFFDRQGAGLADFGTNNLPTANTTMAVFSTGVARDAADPNYVAPDGGLNWASSVTAPLVVPTACGTNVIPAHDSVLLTLLIRVPTNATALHFDADFFTAEYPDDCTSNYNDQAQALVTGLAPGLPPDGNVLLDSVGNPVSAFTAFFEVCLPAAGHTCPSGPGALTGTGYDLPVGGGAATAWLTADVPVVPGEELTLRLILFDGFDGNIDSALLLDHLRWTITPNSVALLFTDGFESGDTTAWSATVP